MAASQKERGPDLQYRNRDVAHKDGDLSRCSLMEEAPAAPWATLGQADSSQVVPRDWSGNGSYLPPGK